MRHPRMDVRDERRTQSTIQSFGAERKNRSASRDAVQGQHRVGVADGGTAERIASWTRLSALREKDG